MRLRRLLFSINDGAESNLILRIAEYLGYNNRNILWYGTLDALGSFVHLDPILTIGKDLA